MLIKFARYHALENDFILIDSLPKRLSRLRLSRLARAICNRRRGVGGDGIILLRPHRNLSGKIDIFNADGSWAELSGNGTRIAGLHCHLGDRRRRRFEFETARQVSPVEIIGQHKGRWMVRSEMGAPVFETAKIPVRSTREFMINAPLKIDKQSFSVTCLSVGNPHAVLFVDSFDFDWETLAAEIECHRAFPRRINVEFVKIITRSKIRVAVWERGAGATGSSGTGAAASVSAGVMTGQLKRSCEVLFNTGSLLIDWNQETDLISLTGPVTYIACGSFDF